MAIEMYSTALHANSGENLHIGRLPQQCLFYILFCALLIAPISATAQTAANFDTLIASASSARDNGNVPRALELYQQAEQLNPSRPDGWWYIGSLEYGINDYGPAITALDHYIALTPKAGPAFALRGLCEFEQAQYPQSLQDLQNGIALGAASQPRNAAIIVYHEGLLLSRMERFEESLAQYAQMIKHGSSDPDLISAIGIAGLRLPVFPKDIDPSQADLVSAVGDAARQYMSGDTIGAKHAFQQLFTQFPSTPNLHYLYGYLLFPTDPSAGIAQFKAELTVSPASAVTHAMLAWAYGLQGDFTASLPNAQAAATEDSSLPMAQLVLGRALVETGNVTAGLTHLEAVLTTEPQNLEAHLALVKAYSKLGRNADARRERLQCLSISGQGAPADAPL